MAKKKLSLKKYFDRKQIGGLILIGLGLLIFYLRPFQECSWYQLGCKSGGLVSTPIFLVIMLVLIIIGVRRLMK